MRNLYYSNGVLLLICAFVSSPARAVPLPTDPKSDSIGRADFNPNRKLSSFPGKIIGVLVSDPHAVVNAEGRAGPKDGCCFSSGGESYRWVYVQAADKDSATIGTLKLPVGDGTSRVFDNLSMATSATTKRFGITTPYALVEVEVNGGLGSQKFHAFAATNMKPLDGTKEFPLQVAYVISRLQKQYDSHLSEKGKDLDAAMDAVAKKALKDRKPSGPRERQTLMYATWMADKERLHVRFLTRISDGEYKYGNGIPIEVGAPPLVYGPAEGGPAPTSKLPQGLRYGTQFGVEYGQAYEVTKTGVLDKTRTLEATPFQLEIPPPPKLPGLPKW